jgi:uncharacterized protein YbjT (DUF2867 family)
MRVLVTGAYGFIGSQIVTALSAAGHEVVCAVRRYGPRGRFGHLPTVTCDMARDIQPACWLPRLTGIDAVVNAAGILREAGGQTFDAVHRAAPCALFEACRLAGVRRVIQISALGTPEDTGFVRSKHEADACLAKLDLDWVVLRPSVVYSSAGSYGGTSLLRAMAALPYVLPVPGGGGQRLQPIHGEDLAHAVVRLLESKDGARRVLEAVGPQALTITEYQTAFRHWLGLPRVSAVRVPLGLIRPVVWLGEKFGRGPLGLTMFRMLERGNVGTPEAYERFAAASGLRPRSLEEALRARPSFVQDRWHARLYFLRPLLRACLGLLWVFSGLVGFLTPLTEGHAMLGQAGVSAGVATALVYGACTLDVAIGSAVLARVAVRLMGVFMLLLLVGYTFFLGTVQPALWLEPFGALVKNIPLVPAVLVMLALEEQR